MERERRELAESEVDPPQPALPQLRLTRWKDTVAQADCSTTPAFVPPRQVLWVSSSCPTPPALPHALSLNIASHGSQRPGWQVTRSNGLTRHETHPRRRTTTHRLPAPRPPQRSPLTLRPLPPRRIQIRSRTPRRTASAQSTRECTHRFHQLIARRRRSSPTVSDRTLSTRPLPHLDARQDSALVYLSSRPARTRRAGSSVGFEGRTGTSQRRAAWRAGQSRVCAVDGRSVKPSCRAKCVRRRRPNGRERGGLAVGD